MALCHASLMLLLAASFSEAATKPHVLMIATDDMRPELSVYGHNYMSTPSLQALADDGFFFRRSYVQQALCAPSRTVLLTGRRPDTSRVWTIGPYFRNTTGKNWSTLPGYFKSHGYRSIGHGKIFHEGNASGFPLDQDQMFGSWSVPFFHPKVNYDHWNKSHSGQKGAPLSHEAVDQPWQSFNDASSALTAVKWIQNASSYSEPFFLAVGFHRPHIPYVYPKEFQIDPSKVQFPPLNHYITQDVPACAPHDWTQEASRYGDLGAIRPPIAQHDFQKNLSSICSSVPLETQRSLKVAYLSCVQYIDHLVGVLVDALKSEGLYEQTTIIFWGDHGYKLGEHCDFFKHDNYEDSTRIPLVLKPASGPHSAAAGRAVEQLVEEVDIFPSLLELVGLPVPQQLQGQSWVPLLQPGKQDAEGKSVVFSQYPHHSDAEDTAVMGYSMRTADWRYTEWLRWECSLMDPMSSCASDASVAPRWEDRVARELYNHTGDPSNDFETYENENLAERPELAELLEQLHQQLKQSWRAPDVP